MSELIDAHARHLRAGRKSPVTIHSRVRLLRQLHAYLPFGLAYASTDELEEWLQHDPTWSDWTMRTYWMHIRGFYRWAHGKWLDGDPSAGLVRPRKPDCVPHPVTDEELAEALRRSGEPWRTAIALAAFAGLRASEAAAVWRQDVTEQSIRIGCAKGGSPAAVDTHPLLWSMVASRPLGPLVVHAGKQVTGKWLSGYSKTHFVGIDLPGVTLHRFRHWFGTKLLEEGADLRTVQEALRHRSITSTQGYTLVRGGQRRLAIRSLPAPTEHPEEN